MKMMKACLLATALTGLSTPAFAQESAGANQLQDIVVTARRREESLQHVPVAVTAVTGDTLQKLAAVNVQDLTRIAPSITIGASSRGGGVPQLGIRGISSADITGGIDPSIGIYMNEVIQNRPNGVLTSLYDVNSVQVLRGPQGTLFGRNTIGGAILITSRQPTTDFEGMARLAGGNYGYISGEAMLNLPFSDSAQLRVAGRFDRRDGYVKSVTTGQDQSDLNNQGIRATLRLAPSDALTSTTVVSYYHQNTHGVGVTTPGLFPAGAFSGGSIVSATNNVADPTNRALIAAAGALRRDNFYRTTSNEIQFDRTKTYDITNTTELTLSDSISLKNIIGYRHVDAQNNFDADASAARQLAIFTYSKFKQLTEEFQVIGDFGDLNVIAGAYYFREAGNDFSQALTAIPFSQITVPRSQSRTGGYIRNTSYSGFLNAGYAITDKLKLTGGIRYTVDKRYEDLNSINITNPFTTPVATCNIGTIVSITPGAGPNGADVIVTTPANPCSLKRSATFKEPTWSVDLSWQATNDILLYAAHRHGYHSGAFNVRATFNVAEDLAKPEFLDDIEIGAKTRFTVGNVPMRLNLAGYYGWYKDIQRTTALPAVVLNGVFRVPSGLLNAASARISGLEVEYNAALFDGFELSAYFAYNKTKYDKFIDATNPAAPLDRSNDLFSYAPKYTGGATGRYTFDVGTKGTQGVLQLNYFHTSSFNDQLTQQPVYTIIPGYDLLNGRIEMNNLSGTGLDAALFVNNITNKKYYTGGTSVVAVGTAPQVVGAPRMYGMEVTAHF